MKKSIFFAMFLMGAMAFSQTITFKGCLPLFENQNYTFTRTATDTSGKSIYITTPVTGDQPCGGLGTCEFKLQWNNTAGRWEFLADSGNGDFVNPFLIYYSTAQNGSGQNPPDNSIGAWAENLPVTNGDCGGNLTAANSTLTGDVRTSVLELNEFGNSKITVYPNPATEIITVTGLSKINLINIVNVEGKLVKTSKNSETVNISNLSPGLYFLQIKTDQSEIRRVKFIKK